mmetsp:Transcript_3415/g.5777  ORF Transcript_3415/g.5777 Transcript_3415/m.5777 type:complete len:153 (-) Transcript_3415:950-1408(-)
MDDKQLQPLFPKQNLIYSQNGRGNNWALGFKRDYVEDHASDGFNLFEQTMEALRKEAERADFFLGSVIFHSLAGGTGSGLGSRIIEEFKDYFPNSYLMSACVWPSMSGDTPLQHYNSCFTLAHIQQNVDACLSFHNDQILKQLNLIKMMSNT